MKNYRVEKAIAASPQKVWACLTDTGRYGESWLMPILGRTIPDLSQSFEDFAVAIQNRMEAPSESQSLQGGT